MPLLILVLVEIVSFGVYWRAMGFWHDDWALLEQMSKLPGFFARCHALLSDGLGARALSPVIFAGLYGLGKMNPQIYQVCLMTFDLLSAWALYLFLKEAFEREDLALSAAVLGLIYPVHSATHHWFAGAAQPIAQALALGSMALHLRWAKTGKQPLLIASLTCYLLSVLTYESTLFFPLAILPFVRPRQAAYYLAPLAAGVFWQRVIHAWLFHTPPWRTVRISLPFILENYYHAVKHLTYGVGEIGEICLRLCSDAFSDSQYILGILFSAALAWKLPAETVRPERKKAAWLCAGLLLLAAYAPYALSGRYEPEIVGIMSRTSAGGGLAAGVILALALAEIKPRWGKTGALFLLVAGFTCINWYISLKWTQAYQKEEEIVGKIAEKIKNAAPGPLTILLRGAPLHFQGVVIFEKQWGLTSMLRLRTGRPDIQGRPVEPGMRIESYQGLLLYDYPENKLLQVVP